MDTDPVEHGVNVPLLRKVLEHITAHPEEHDQEAWAQRTSCGTSYCLAGHVALAEGHEIDWSELDGDGTGDVEHVVGDKLIDEVAVDALGICWNYDGARSGSGHLFSTSNTLADLWRIASELTHGEITVPADLPGGIL